MKLYSNEIVFRGHPDKVADQISDALLDKYLMQDKNTRAGIEVVGGKNKIFVTGEVASKAKVNADYVVKRVLGSVGYNPYAYEVINNIGLQSEDIAQGVDVGGAGDQGMMFGYACNNTSKLLPKAMVILQYLSRYYDLLRQKDNRFLPDGKAQITGYYDNDFNLVKIKTFTISYQNTELDRHETDEIIKQKALEICNIYNIGVEEFLINPTGKFLIGGFDGDAGLTGRKIVVDNYQSFANVGGGAFCVDGDTEYLTKDGWMSMNNYKEGTEIAQWNNGVLEFVKPQAYIKCKANNLYHITSPTSYDMVLSDKHDLVIKTSKGNIIKKQLREILDENLNVKNGNIGSVPMFFTYQNDLKGIDLSENEIRLQIAYCADGSMLSSKHWNGRIRVKKNYKKERLEYLLAITNTNYKASQDGDCSIYYFNPPINNKSLKECFGECNYNQFKVIADEIFRWDGSIEDKVFRTTLKDDADFIQFVLMSVLGTRVSIGRDDRVGELTYNGYERKSVCYEVRVCKNKYSALRFNKTGKFQIEIKPFISNDGFMYCFSVDSGMLILRRNDRVFITGNSGKDSTKVDRSGAYKARHIARKILLENSLKWCEVQLSYAIGIAEPLAIYIDSNIGNINPSKDLYEECIPSNIIKQFNLTEPIYEETAMFGHFGNSQFVWER